MSESLPIFQISKLTVNYGRSLAVRDLSLVLPSGCSLGLLGLNGAGKTSTIRALLGMLKPSSGSASLFGMAPHKAFSSVGFVPENGGAPEFLSAGEYLDFVGSYRIKDIRVRRARIQELCQWLDLDCNKRIGTYSKGMKRRLVISQAFLGEPKLLVMDEPLGGLDPLMIVKLREYLERFRQNGGSLLYSSHILAEVEKICSHAAILSRGELVCHASVSELVREFGSVEKAFTVKVGGVV